MKIQVSFYEAANYTAKHPEMAFYAFEKDGNPDTLNEIGEELADILICLFFNGVEHAARYTGFDSKKQVFKFELAPN